MPTPTATYESLRLTPWPKNISWVRRASTFILAYVDLLYLDIQMRRGFKVVRGVVARTPVASRQVDYDALTLVRVAVRDACIFYIKPAHCLQRSSAVARMLRRRGISADLVIGYHAKPVGYHAWVEIDHRVVWDHRPNLAFYHAADRV
jgi:hypothetical protein